MTKITSFFRDLHNDNDGAAFIEYTALLGVILAVSIAVIGGVGTWGGQVWTWLCNNLDAGPSGSGIAACVP